MCWLTQPPDIRQYRLVANEAWEIVGERLRRFEQGRLRLSQLTDELVALRHALNPPGEGWAGAFDSALTGLKRALASQETGERIRRIADPEPAAFPVPEPEYDDVRDYVQTIQRLVSHPDDA